MIKPGDMIKHKDAMDVCFDVHHVYDAGPTLDLTGLWWNMGFNRSWLCPTGKRGGAAVVVIKVKKEDVDNWLSMVYPRANVCMRYCEWVKHG